MNEELDAILAHHGVKGMKWGHRKAGGAQESRKDHKARVKTERDKFYNDRATEILKKSVAKGDNVLIKTRRPGDYGPTVLTGKEFTQHLQRGGAFDVKMTDVFAEFDKKVGAYVQNETPTPQFVKPTRRKG